MSIQEARRAAFEDSVRARAKDTPQGIHPLLLTRFACGDYRTSWVYAAWWAWNAALDSVCVVLPESDPAPRHATSYQEGLADGIERGLRNATRAIEAAGVKCK